MTMPSATASPVISSSAVNARAATRAESRMLIDGELREAASGARFDNLSPATGKVLGSTAAVSSPDMESAIGAARRAFDDTDWKSNRALRKRCLLHSRARSNASARTFARRLSPR